MEFQLKEHDEFKYVEEGNGPVILLLHGLFGALSNFREVINHFSKNFTVTIPMLPLYTSELKDTSVTGMVKFVERFVEWKGYKDVNLIGNSLGGHIALIYSIRNLKQVKSIILTGSSGLFESAMGDGYPKKSDYEYVKKKTQYTFYDPETATKELVDEVYDIVNDRRKAISTLYLAKSAVRHNLREELQNITCPSLLIWGNQDRITPPFVGEEFDKLLPDSKLHFLEKCGHAPMMELPEQFNTLVEKFLTEKVYAA